MSEEDFKDFDYAHDADVKVASLQVEAPEQGDGNKAILRHDSLSDSEEDEQEEEEDVALLKGNNVMKSISMYEEMNSSCRNTMEDEIVYNTRFLDDPNQAYFAVYDGHGGRGVVEHVAESLEYNIMVELEHNRTHGNMRSISQCLTAAFLITDIETAKKNLMESGSTACVNLIRKEGDDRVLYSANVGDTRAVLSRGGVAHRLSNDHKAGESTEVKRIENSGGFIMRKRVLGILSVSRSFGDHSMKKYVIAKPYISKTILRSSDDYLILACDGLWDVISDQEAIDLVQKFIAESKKARTSFNKKDLAKMLVSESLSRGSTDNVSVMVIEL